MAAVDSKSIAEQVSRSIPSGWKDLQQATRARRMVEMQRRPGRWWRKLDWLAKQRRHKGFRRACVYLLELRAVAEDGGEFLRRLSFFRRAQRRRRDLIVFLNETGLTVPGEPMTWEELVAAYPLKPRKRRGFDNDDGVVQLYDPFREIDRELDEWEAEEDDEQEEDPF